VIDEAGNTARGKSLWRKRDFMFLWTGQASSEIGSAVTLLAIPIAAVVLLKSTTLEVAILSGLGMVPSMLFALPAGVIVDRVAKRKLMLWCDIGRFLLLASIPLATLPGLHVTYAQLLIVTLFSGLLAVGFDIAYQTYLPGVLTGEELMEANGRLGTTASFAEFVGPSLGGGLVGLLGAARAISADAATYALSVVSLLLIRKPEPEPEPRAAGRSMRREIAEGFGFVVKHPILRNVVACMGTFNFFVSMISAVEIVFLVRILHVSPAGVGLVFSFSAIGGMLAGLAAGRLSKLIGSARLIWVSALVFGLPTFAMPLASPGWGALLFAGGNFFYLFRGVVFGIAQVTYRQAITPAELLGRVTASQRFLTGSGMPLGALVGGVLGTEIGVRETLWVAVAGSWCAGLWVFFSPLRTMRDLDVPEEPQSDGSPAGAGPEPVTAVA